jgi:HK97 family phage major capsid protein
MRAIVLEDLPNRAAALRSANVSALMRACAAAALGAYDRTTSPANVLAASWPHDRDAARLLETRAATSPTTTASFAALMSRTVADFIESLAPASAGAALLGQGLQLTFGTNVAISVPSFLANAANVGWVDEAAPIPVRQLNVLGGPILEPDKLAVLTALTNEMISGSNAEAMVRDALTQSAALALDAALLDANASTTARPAGLRYGIAALTASALTDRTEAMLADIATVAAAVAPVAGNTGIALIANPVRAMTLRLRSPRELSVAVLASSAVAAGDLIAVAPPALVSAVGAVQIKADRESTVHMYDPADAIAVPGSPNVVSAPCAARFRPTRSRCGCS